MLFEIQTPNGPTVKVEAVDWSMALARAVTDQGIEVAGWICFTLPDGTTQVMDSGTGKTWVIRRLNDELAASSAIAKTLTPPPAAREARPEQAFDAPVRADLVSRSQPTPEQILPEEEPPEELAETLFELSNELYATAGAGAAANKTLEILMRLIDCEAGSVLRGTRDEQELTFVACAGPAAKKLIGKKMYFGQGVVGAAFDLNIPIQVEDVTSDDRYLDRFDKETGFSTKSVLCVPIRHQLDVLGAIELLNPKRRFLPWHRDTMESVARMLGGLLSGR